MKLFLDVETTGVFEPTSKIWSLSGFLENEGDLIWQFDYQFTPNDYQVSDWNIERGITQEYLENLPVKSRDILLSFMKDLKKNLGGQKTFIYAWQAAFDYFHIYKWFEEYGRSIHTLIYPSYIDIKSLILERYLDEIQDLPKLDLKTIAEYFGLENNAHESLSDARVATKLYYKLI